MQHRIQFTEELLIAVQSILSRLRLKFVCPALGFAVFCAAISPVNADTVTFDSFDSATDFGPDAVIITNNHGGSPGSTATDIPGFPGEVRLTSSVSTGGSGWYGHMLPATYTPSTDGNINFIDYSVELRDPDLGSRADGATFEVAMLIQQDGNFYVGPSFEPDDSITGYTAFSAQVSSTDFLQSSGTLFDLVAGSHPDFSSSGSQIQFGVTSASATGSTVITPVRVADIRGLSITLNTVPEPSGILIVLLSAGGFLARRRRALL